MKRLNSILLSVALVLLCSFSVQAQSAGAPGSAITFDTSPNGSPLGHLQGGTFGDIVATTANWAALGQAPFPATGGPYGLRLQRSGAFGLFNLINGDLKFEQDLVVAWGGEREENDFRLRYIRDQFANVFTDVLVANSAAKVGIGSEPGSARLRVESSDVFDAAVRGVNTSIGYGVEGIGEFVAVRGLGSSPGSTFNVYGVFGNANAGGNCYGVYGSAGGGSFVDYAVYGVASNASPDWAGFFSGRAFTTAGVWTPSDRRLKRDIQKAEGALEKVMQLKAYNYDYDNEKFEFMVLPEGRQYGFIAQELQEVFPEMVTDVQHPVMDENGKKLDDNFEFIGVNYDQMVPVLTAALQEQQALIEQLTQRIEELEAEGRSGASKSFGDLGIQGKAELFQNTPNPFNERTTIRYTLPANYSNAAIYVFNMNGQQIASYQNLAGEELTIEGNALEAGMYFYSLVVDGAEMDVKRMVLTK